jgi:hypothetical protein
MVTCHHLGRGATWEWAIGASSLRIGASKAPSTKAIVGKSSIAPSVLPQVGQNARHDVWDDRHIAGVPPGPVHST